MMKLIYITYVALLMSAQDVLGARDDQDMFANRHDSGCESDDGVEPPEDAQSDRATIADEDPSSSSSKEAKLARRRANRRVWPCSDHQKAYIIQKRKEFDANPKALTSTSWVVTPNDPAPRARTVAPKHGDFCLHPWGGWVPERIWPKSVSAPWCPTCERNDKVNTASARWRRAPRRVLGRGNVSTDPRRGVDSRQCESWLLHIACHTSVKAVCM